MIIFIIYESNIVESGFIERIIKVLVVNKLLRSQLEKI